MIREQQCKKAGQIVVLILSPIVFGQALFERWNTIHRKIVLGVNVLLYYCLKACYILHMVCPGFPRGQKDAWYGVDFERRKY